MVKYLPFGLYSYKRMILRFAFVFIFLLLFSLSVKAEEAKIIEIVVKETSTINLIGISKFIISNPDLVDVTIKNNQAEIKAKQDGNTTVYLLSKGKMVPYLIKVLPYVQNYGQNSNIFQSKVSYIKNDKAFGTYNFSSNVSFNPAEKTSSQFFSHSLSYKIPMPDKAELNLNTNFLNLFNDFSSLSELSVQNIGLNYQGSFFEAQLGDLYFSGKTMGNLNTSLKGLRFALKNKNIYDRFEVFSGLEQKPLNIYSKKNINDENRFLLSGISANQSLSENLKVGGMFLSKVDLVNSNSKIFNLNGNIAWNPSESFALSGNFGTDFSTIAYDTTSSYTHSWSDRGEWAKFAFNIKKLGKNLNKSQFFEEDSIMGNVQLKHISDLRLGINYSFSLSDGLLRNSSGGFNLSYLLPNNISIYSNTNFSSGAGLNNNNFQFGLDFNTKILPSSFTYTYSLIDSIKKERNSLNTLKLNSKIYRSPLINFNLVELFSFNNERISNTLFLNSNFVVSSFLDFAFNLGYSFDKNQTINSLGSSSINFNMLTNLDINYYHKLTLNLSMNGGYDYFNNFIPLLSTNINYTWHIGRETEQILLRGNIKGLVFEDLNNNGKFDTDEKNLSGIKVILKDKTVTTGSNGFFFENLDHSNYVLSVDESTLPSGYTVTTQAPILVVLKENEKEISFGVRKEITIRGFVTNNLKRTMGLSDIKLILDQKENYFTDYDGSFIFKTEPGKHRIMIDPRSIPTGYKLQGSLIRDIDTNKPETVDFVLYFSSTFKAKVEYLKNNIKEKAKNIELTIKLLADENETEITVVTDEDGEFTLNDLRPGSIEISSPYLSTPVTYIITQGVEKNDLQIILDKYEQKE